MSDADEIRAGDPRYDGFRVTEAFAFLQIDPADDQEGSPTMVVSQDPMVLAPMMGLDARRAQSLKPLARHYAKATGRRVRLVRFRELEEVEVFEPPPRAPSVHPERRAGEAER